MELIGREERITSERPKAHGTWRTAFPQAKGRQPATGKQQLGLPAPLLTSGHLLNRAPPTGGLPCAVEWQRQR